MTATAIHPFKLNSGEWIKPGDRLELMQINAKYYKLLTVNGNASGIQTISKLTLKSITTTRSNIRQLTYNGRWLMTGPYPYIKAQYNILCTDPTVNEKLLKIEPIK